jgi:hypothetical protein
MQMPALLSLIMYLRLSSAAWPASLEGSLRVLVKVRARIAVQERFSLSQLNLNVPYVQRDSTRPMQ